MESIKNEYKLLVLFRSAQWKSKVTQETTIGELKRDLKQAAAKLIDNFDNDTFTEDHIRFVTLQGDSIHGPDTTKLLEFYKDKQDCHKYTSVLSSNLLILKTEEAINVTIKFVKNSCEIFKTSKENIKNNNNNNNNNINTTDNSYSNCNSNNNENQNKNKNKNKTKTENENKDETKENDTNSDYNCNCNHNAKEFWLFENDNIEGLYFDIYENHLPNDWSGYSCVWFNIFNQTKNNKLLKRINGGLIKDNINKNDILICSLDGDENPDKLKASEYKIQIFCKVLTGKSITLDAVKQQKIYNVKWMIRCKEGMPTETQRIIFGGRQMQDHRTIEDYNLIKESTFHLVLRARGS